MFFMKFDTKKNFFWMILDKVRNTIFFLFLISSVISAGSLETNWEHLSNHSILHMNGNKIFDFSNDFNRINKLSGPTLCNSC